MFLGILGIAVERVVMYHVHDGKWNGEADPTMQQGSTVECSWAPIVILLDMF